MIPTSLLLAIAAASLAPAPIPVLSSELNDYNLSIDRNERTRVFARSEADFRNARIFVSTREKGKWSEPTLISFSRDGFSDSDPWLTPDGSTLYFISDRPAAGRDGGRTDYDVWRSRRTTTGWTAPEHLGPQVNSKGQELGPELHEGTLYFSSARAGGPGGLDIYAAKEAGTGFAPAVRLDAPINSAQSDSDFTLSSDGKFALFWRSDEQGGASIYRSWRREGSWSPPEVLPDAVNSGPFNFTPSLSSDSTTLYLATTRPRPGQASGMADIYAVPMPSR